MFVSALLHRDRKVKPGKALFMYKSKDDVTNLLNALGFNVLKVGNWRVILLDKKVIWDVMKDRYLCGSYKHGVMKIH